MSVFDLLFICVVLGSAVTLAAVAVAAVRGNRGATRRTLIAWGACIAVYLAALLAVSLATPIRVLSVGDTQCSDDWCLTVVLVQRSSPAPRMNYLIDFRIESRARRVTQRENGLEVHLVGERGTRYDPIPDPPGAPRQFPFNVLLLPGQSLTTTRQFEIPENAGRLNLVVARDGFQVTWLIIGRNPFDGRTVVKID